MVDFTVKPLEADLDFGQLHYWAVAIIRLNDKISAAARTRTRMTR